jgi:hypothetical protein
MRSLLFSLAILPSVLAAHPGHSDAFSDFAHAMGDADHLWAVPLVVGALAAAFFIRAKRKSQARI